MQSHQLNRANVCRLKAYSQASSISSVYVLRTLKGKVPGQILCRLALQLMCLSRLHTSPAASGKPLGPLSSGAHLSRTMGLPYIHIGDALHTKHVSTLFIPETPTVLLCMLDCTASEEHASGVYQGSVTEHKLHKLQQPV